MAFRPVKNLEVTLAISARHTGAGVNGADHTVTVTGRILRNSEAAAFLDGLRAPAVRAEGVSDADWLAVQTARARRLANSDAEFMKRVIIGWDADSGIEDEDGRPLPFSPAALDLVLDHPWFLAAAVQAYNRALSGARAGN